MDLEVEIKADSEHLRDGRGVPLGAVLPDVTKSRLKRSARGTLKTCAVKLEIQGGWLTQQRGNGFKRVSFEVAIRLPSRKNSQTACAPLCEIFLFWVFRAPEALRTDSVESTDTEVAEEQ
ncbi:hypothetical protein E1301_Tti002109 [Triplophysa tibetana]|uniref:Uncharacterized protein n=1 Tax=Triplophysa tibetana TaxID=1572043 RepID=A0A5A9PGB2_9TELE|nr:hypothetical protein E1301_Tti002109 [Triplophysa tibetana]